MCRASFEKNELLSKINFGNLHSINMQSNTGQDLGIVELEHVIGYNGKYPDTIHHIPNSKNSYVYPIGGLVVIEDLNDKHNQRFLRGHDMAITTVATGSSGTLNNDILLSMNRKVHCYWTARNRIC